MGVITQSQPSSSLLPPEKLQDLPSIKEEEEPQETEAPIKQRSRRASLKHFIGYDMGTPAIQVCETFTQRKDKELIAHTTENDENVRQLELINNVLARIRSDRHLEKANNTVDYTNDPVMKRQLAEVYQLLGVPLPEPLKWKGEAIDAIENMLMDHEKLILNRSNVSLMQIKRIFEDKDRVIDIMREIIKQYCEHLKSCNRRQGT